MPAASGQEPVVSDLVEEIVIVGAGSQEEEIRKALRTQVGHPLDANTVRRDQEWLWKRRRVLVEAVRTRVLPSGGLRVAFHVSMAETVQRLVFRGNEEFDRQELLAALGLSEAQVIDVTQMDAVAEDVARKYRREGWFHVEVHPVLETDPQQLVLQIQEGPLVRIGSVDFVGNAGLPSSTPFGIGSSLTGVMDLGDGWLVFPGSVYSEAAVQRDLVALESLYHDFGWLDARVTVESSDFFRSRKDRVALVLRVVEGPLYRVASIRVQADDGQELLYSEQELLTVIGLAPGDPYEASRLAADQSALRRFYGSRGHPAAVFSNGDAVDFFAFCPPDGKPKILTTPDTHEVAVVYGIREGIPMRIRRVLITGNRQTKDAVIRRQIELEPGDLADSDKALRAWRRLIGLGWFRDSQSGQPFVDWRFLQTDRPEWVDLRFEVEEGQTGNLLFGGGINSNFGPFLSINLQKENFDLTRLPSSWGSTLSEILDGRAFTGGGQTLRISAAPGSQFSTYSLRFTEPDLFSDHVNRVSFSMGGSSNFLYLRTHEEVRGGGNIRLGRNFGRHFSVWGGPEFQSTDLRNPDSGAPQVFLDSLGPHTTQGVSFGFTWDTIADPFSPVDGHVLKVGHRRLGGPYGGDWSFHATDVAAQKHIPLGQDSRDRPWVLSLAGRWGQARPHGPLTEIPYPSRYFLGGRGSLRGFDYRGVGPIQNGFSLGGDDVWNATAEFRFPILSSRVRDSIAETEYLRGAVWLDAGALGSLGNFSSPRMAAGFGIRFRMPFMPQLPLSLDFGWPLQDEFGDNHQIMAFSLGEFIR